MPPKRRIQMIKISTVIKNSNGKEYMVLKHSGDYTLLARLEHEEEGEQEEYVIAKYLEEYKDGYSWAWGVYSISLINALDIYISKLEGSK